MCPIRTPRSLAGAAALSLLAAFGIAPADAAVQQVFVIAMENTNWTQPAGQSIQQILGNPAAPFLNALVNGTLATTVAGQTISSQTAYAAAYHNVLATPSGNNPSIHPSEPNYLWSEGGTNYGVFNDNTPYGPGGTNQATNRHLSAYLLAAGRTVRSYQEDTQLVGSGATLTNQVLPPSQWTVPLNNASGSSASYTNPYNGSHQFDYAAKHNPMVFFSDTNGGNNSTPANPAAHLYAPLEQLQADLDANTVADYNWITPNQFNDMHTPLAGGFSYRGTTYTGQAASIAQGDNFLSIVVPRIMASQAYQNGAAIVLWWDEAEGVNADSYGTTIPEIVISKQARANVAGKPYASPVNLTHSDDLRTMQNLFGVNPLTGVDYLGDAANAQGLDDLFAPGAVAAVPEAPSSTLMVAGLVLLARRARRR